MTRPWLVAGMLSLALLAAAAGPVAGEADELLETRSFIIEHKGLDDVVTLVRPALSDWATVVIQTRQRTVTFTDRAPVLDEVAELIRSFDVPPRDVAININLIKASRRSPGRPASLLPGRLPPSLQEMTKWLDYELLGGMSMLTTETDRSSLLLGEEYRIRFQVDLVDDRSGRVRLRDFVLERRVLEPGGGETHVPIFDTVVNLKSGTPYVFGATRGEASEKALFLTITANIAP